MTKYSAKMSKDEVKAAVNAETTVLVKALKTQFSDPLDYARVVRKVGRALIDSARETRKVAKADARQIGKAAIKAAKKARKAAKNTAKLTKKTASKKAAKVKVEKVAEKA